MAIHLHSEPTFVERPAPAPAATAVADAASLFAPSEAPRGLRIWFGFDAFDSGREIGAVVAAFAFAAMVFLAPLMTLSDATGSSGGGAVNGGDQGNTVRQIAYLLIFLLALWAADPLRRGWRVLLLPLPFVVALSWCWASLSWAIDPGIGFRRLLLTAMVIWTCFIIARAAGYRQTVATLRLALAVALVMNWLVVFGDPELGKHTLLHTGEETALIGDWRGFMAHKNFAGAACALTIILYSFDCRTMPPWLRWGVIVLAATFLWESGSKTSAGMALLALLSAAIYMRTSRHVRIYAIPALAFGGALIGMAYSTWDNAISALILRPTAFTGRGTIWAMLARYIHDNPWLGAGFGSFWDIGFASPVYQYGSGYQTVVTVGHNGYLDLIVTVGFPGMLLVAFAMLVWPLVRLLSAPAVRPQTGALICAVVVFGIGHNITESSMFARDALVGVFLVFAAAFAELQTTVLRRAPRSGNKRSAGDELMSAMRKRQRKAS